MFRLGGRNVPICLSGWLITNLHNDFYVKRKTYDWLIRLRLTWQY